MSSIESKFKNLRVEEVAGRILGERREIYKGMPSTSIVALNMNGVDALVSKGHRPLTYGDKLQRAWLALHDAPELGLIALRLITKLHQPVVENPEKPLGHLEHIELFPVGADFFI